VSGIKAIAEISMLDSGRSRAPGMGRSRAFESVTPMKPDLPSPKIRSAINRQPCYVGNMNRSIKVLFTVVANLVIWGAVIVGCLVTTGSIADLYMILVGGAHPGDVIYLDTLAPTTKDAAQDLLLGLAIISSPFILRGAFRRWLATR
jgi:hypothetical protein